MYIRMPSDTQVSKWGNSLAVRIPKTIIKEARLADGDRLSLDVAQDGSVVLRSGRQRYSLKRLVAGIKPGNHHHETNWGAPKGREVW